MTHWYSRTPEDFLAKKKPDFIPLANKGANYQVPNAQVWNIRDDKWVDEYWKMTKTAVAIYGAGAPAPRLLHTIGLGERMCYKDRKRNFDMKILALDKFLAKAHTDYPDAKVLLAGWDFYSTWKPEEVQALLPRLDPTRDIIWDYEGDLAPHEHNSGNWFGKWGLVGQFPYTYSMFLAYENALDIRANYPIIEERQKIVQNDPFCKGFISARTIRSSRSGRRSCRTTRSARVSSSGPNQATRTRSPCGTSPPTPGPRRPCRTGRCSMNFARAVTASMRRP